MCVVRVIIECSIAPVWRIPSSRLWLRALHYKLTDATTKTASIFRRFYPQDIVIFPHKLRYVLIKIHVVTVLVGSIITRVRNLRKATIGPVISVRPSAWNNSTPTGTDFHEIWYFRDNLPRHFRPSAWNNSTSTATDFHEIWYFRDNWPRHFRPSVRMEQFDSHRNGFPRNLIFQGQLTPSFPSVRMEQLDFHSNGFSWNLIFQGQLTPSFPSVRPSAWNNSTPTGTDFHEIW